MQLLLLESFSNSFSMHYHALSFTFLITNAFSEQMSVYPSANMILYFNILTRLSALDLGFLLLTRYTYSVTEHQRASSQ